MPSIKKYRWKREKVDGGNVIYILDDQNVILFEIREKPDEIEVYCNSIYIFSRKTLQQVRAELTSIFEEYQRVLIERDGFKSLKEVAGLFDPEDSLI